MEVGLGLLLMAVMMGGMMLGGHWLGRKSGGPKKHAPTTAVCPVSGNRIAISSTTVRATVGGKAYYFDNEEHQREFVLDPERFLRGGH